MPVGETIAEYWLYATEFLRHPVSTSCITPTSWKVTAELASRVPREARRVLSLGPGSGRLERMILASGRLSPDAQILSIEKNPRFADFVRDRVRDPRLRLIQGSAEELDDIATDLFGPEETFDAAFGNIPLSVMNGTRRGIMSSLARRLRPGARLHLNIYNDVTPILREHFRNVLTRNHYGCIPRQRLHEAWNDPEPVAVERNGRAYARSANGKPH